MKRIILSAFISTALVGSTFAQAPSPAFNGVYLGGGLTYSNGKIENKSSTLNTVGYQGTLGGSSKGVGFNGFLGYGSIFGGGFYLGGELGLGFDGSRFKNRSAGTGDFSGLKFKSGSNLTYSIAARLGYAFANVLPYFKVGFEGRSAVKLVRPDGNNARWGNSDISIGRKGFILGAGIDYALTKNVFIRGEYTHNFGSRTSLTLNNIKVADFRSKTDTFLIGAAYKF